MSIYGNAVGGTAPIKTLIMTDEDGNEITGVVTGSEVIFDATPADVRIGKKFASNEGIQVGELVVSSSYGSIVLSANSEAAIPAPEYEYSHLMVTICRYDTNEEQSVVPMYVSVGDAMYDAISGTKLSDIAVDTENGQINLGITVNEEYVLRYCVIG